MGYEQVEDGTPFCFLAAAVSRQSDQRRQNHWERPIADQQPSSELPLPLRLWRPSWLDWSIACSATACHSSTEERSFTTPSTANCKSTILNAKPPILDS